MTGVLNAMVGASAIERRTVTLAVSGNEVGFVAGTMGSITSVTLRTTSIITLWSGNTFDIWLDLNGVLSQSYFRQIRIQDGAGALQTLDPSVATFSNPGGTQTRWIWGDGSPRFWALADSGELKTVEFVF